MTALVWSKAGERFYETGIDRGVLYLHDGTVAVWNGLTGIEETPNGELKSFYLDGVKYLETLTPSDYVGKLTAFSYPEEFNAVNGLVEIAPGLSYDDQPPSSFNLSYRTGLGNDIKGNEYGYKLHILYNVIASPDAYTISTIGADGFQATEFAWGLTGTPSKFLKFRPTVHVVIDSTNTPDYILKVLEDQLYGTDTIEPSLPPIETVAELFGYLGALVIVDNGDGSWMAIDESDTFITMISPTQFQIDDADATYLDAVTYEISSTNVS